MNIKDFMKNPAGKGAVIPGRDMIIDRFNYRYGLLIKKKPFDVTIYKVKDDVLYHVIVTTEAEERWNTYDVVLKFVPTDMVAKNDTTVKNYELKVFSNCPSFTYTYAYVAKLNNMMVSELENKYDKKVLSYPPVSRNPSLTMSYEKSVYYACKFLLESNMLSKKYIDSHTSKTVTKLLSEIRTDSKIEEEIQRAKNKQKEAKEQELREIRRKAVTKQKRDNKFTPKTKSSVNHLQKKGSTVNKINKKKSTIKPKGTMKKK